MPKRRLLPPRRLVRPSNWLQSSGIAAFWRFRPFQGVESAIVVFRLEYATLLSGVVFTHPAALRSGKQYRAREQHQCRSDQQDLAHPPVICGCTTRKITPAIAKRKCVTQPIADFRATCRAICPVSSSFHQYRLGLGSHFRSVVTQTAQNFFQDHFLENAPGYPRPKIPIAMRSKWDFRSTHAERSSFRSRSIEVRFDLATNRLVI
jgi:hypothetical protein